MAHGFFGGSPAECPEIYQRCSPVAYINGVRAPLFIWVGAQDTLITSRQIEKYIARLRALGRRVEAVWYNGGHGGPVDALADQVNTLARKIEFVKSVLGR